MKQDATKENLLEQAKQEPTKTVEVDPEVVKTLREKGFSWRGIAAWLNRRGITVSHTWIYRRYK